MLAIDTSLFFLLRPETSPSLHSLTLDHIGFSFPLRQPDTYQSSWPRLVSALRASADTKLKACTIKLQSHEVGALMAAAGWLEPGVGTDELQM
jgi:hypothetical protein